MFKNIVIFRLTGFKLPSLTSLETAMKPQQFTACGPTQERSKGWAPPRGQAHGALLEVVGGEYIFALETESKSVPGSVVAEELSKRCKAIEAKTGRKPGKKEKRELKDEIKQDLLPRAFSRKGRQLAWLDADNGLLMVGASSHKGAEAFVSLFIELMANAGEVLTISKLQTQKSPSSVMTDWLMGGEAGGDFFLGQEAEMKQPADKSTVKYAKHNLSIKEISDHLAKGKVPTKLMLTWDGQVSFALNDQGVISKLTFEVPEDSAESGEDAFDANVVLATGQLSSLIESLIEQLGGEVAI